MASGKRRKRWPKGSLGALCGLCVQMGREKALEYLEAVHRQAQSAEATAWEDPATYAWAWKIQAIVTRQAISLGHLKRMTEDEMRRNWNDGWMLA